MQALIAVGVIVILIFLIIAKGIIVVRQAEVVMFIYSNHKSTDGCIE